MNRFLPIFIVLVCVFTVVQVQAQSLSVSGVVSDEQGNPLPGVSIQVKGTTRGAVTDSKGSFSVANLSSESTLVFSFIGFITKEVLVGNQTNITISLQEDIETLNEIVVVGYGTVKKSDLTGSVSSVKGNDLIKIPANNPVQALQGKVAGVQVSSISGAPGAGVSVRVRGTGTFNNAAPIFVVDGVILDDISFLNASDIQSMEVLKDASSTAIYGSRGANGVILVTTKKGKTGNEAPIINVSADFSVQRLAKKIDLLNGKQFATIYNEISPGRFNNVDAVPNTDWQDLIFRDAPMQNIQLSATGGSAKNQYFVSFGYFNQEGIIPKSGYERISVRFNNTYHLSNKIRLGSNITFAPERIQNAPNVVFSVYRAQPTSVPFYLSGPLAGQYGAVPNVGNPLADIEFNNSTFRRFRSVSNVFGEWDIIKGLTVRSSFSVDLNFGRSRNFSPAYTIFNEDGTATPQQNVFSDISKGTTDNAQWLLENTITYSKEIGKSRFNLLAGYTMQSTSNETIRLSGENLQRDNSDFWYIRPSYVYDESNGINRIG
ncbi:MAG: SusC/RagA family TonB-linked outer membrane protein, partial [Chryseotalea sp.]